MSSVVVKNLQPGWYTFGDMKNIRHVSSKLFPKKQKFDKGLYNINNCLPEISVQCIVGMNGSGKSTLLDIFYRIINNFAYVIEKPKNRLIRYDLSYSYGIMADLYFEVDDNYFVIKCFEDDNKIETTKLYKIVANDELEIHLGNPLDSNSILQSLFYTIGVNYGMYAFNKHDYEDPYNSSVNGNWLQGLFHKNDGYLTPLTLVPYRKDGQINMINELKLAKQRIIAISILASFKGYAFPPGYWPHTIYYSFNKHFIEEKLDSFLKNYPDYNSNLLKISIKNFEELWEQILEEKLSDIYSKNGLEYHVILFYLAYKSLKVCLTYSDFYSVFGCEVLFTSSDSDEFLFAKNSIPERTLAAFDKIRESDDHITLKIRQCVNFVLDGGEEREGKIPVQSFHNLYSPTTIDDVFKHLYPPFYEVDLSFIKVRKQVVTKSGLKKREKGKEVMMSCMSSGEKQFLFSMSYILYHLKNLQSVKDDENRVHYNHVNVIIDEAELYYHPEMQRSFINQMLQMITWSGINKEMIKSINILIATHSPFILSDILRENTLYLKNGVRSRVRQQTFGANFYDMLKSSFFLNKSTVGEIALQRINGWIEESGNGRISAREIQMIGDPIVRAYMEDILRLKHK